jgi:hypothetical protein
MFKFLFFDQYLNNSKGESQNKICEDFVNYFKKLKFDYKYDNFFNDFDNESMIYLSKLKSYEITTNNKIATTKANPL